MYEVGYSIDICVLSMQKTKPSLDLHPETLACFFQFPHAQPCYLQVACKVPCANCWSPWYSGLYKYLGYYLV